MNPDLIWSDAIRKFPEYSIQGGYSSVELPHAEISLHLLN
jgi:hypothetical protein